MEEGDPDLFFDDLGTVGGEEDAAPIPLPEAVDKMQSMGCQKKRTPSKLFKELLILTMTMNQLPKMFQQWQTHQTGLFLQNGAMTGFVSGRVRILEVLMQDKIFLWIQHVMATMFNFLSGSSPKNCYKMSLTLSMRR